MPAEQHPRHRTEHTVAVTTTADPTVYSGPRALIVPEDAWRPVAEALRAAGYGLHKRPHAPEQMPRYETRRAPGIAGNRPARRHNGDRDQISDREMQVLRGFAAGMSNREIGRELHLSEETVKTHARRLFDKLGVHDRAGAVNVAWQRGILGGDS